MFESIGIVLIVLIFCSVVGDWELVMLELYQEQGDSWNPAPGNRLHDREAQLSRKVQESKEDYEAAVDYLNQLQQDIFSNQLPKVNTCVCVCIK